MIIIEINGYNNNGDDMNWNIEKIKAYIIENKITTKILSAEYFNNSSKLTWMCGCGEEFTRDFAHFKRESHKCNSCMKEQSAVKQRLSLDKVTEAFVKKGLTLLDENSYRGVSSKMTATTIDGYKIVTTYNDLLASKFARTLWHKSNHYSVENIRLYLRLNNINLILLSDTYENNTKAMKWMCECGEVFARCLAKVVDRSSYFCGKCSNENKKIKQSLSESTVELRILDKGYIPMFGCGNKYINSGEKFSIKDSKGYLYETTARLLLSDNFSPQKFSSTNKHTLCNLKLYIIRYDILVELLSNTYINNSTYYEFKCECGEVYSATLASFIHNRQHKCAKCSLSKSILEWNIIGWLQANNILFEEQKTFKGCLGDYALLRFDFYLPSCNILIEADGIHHYRPVDYSDKDSVYAFEKRKRYDTIKNLYAKRNNIKLIRIPYWDFKTGNYKVILRESIK